MIYVEIKTNKIVGLNTIRRENKNISIPDGADCVEFGYEKLVVTPKPVKDGFIAIEKDPVNYVQQWELVSIPSITPSSISPRQARLQLMYLDKLGLVEPSIETLAEPAKSVAKVEWEYATQYEITHPFVVQMLGLLEIDKEEFFLAASRL